MGIPRIRAKLVATPNAAEGNIRIACVPRSSKVPKTCTISDAGIGGPSDSTRQHRSISIGDEDGNKKQQRAKTKVR